jgi:hypothetical protein
MAAEFRARREAQEKTNGRNLRRSPVRSEKEGGGDMNTLELLEKTVRSPWRRRDLANNIFGTCPECPGPEITSETHEGPYTVVHIDEYPFAICETHKVRWSLGYYSAPPRYHLIGSDGNFVLDANGLAMKDPNYPGDQIRSDCKMLLGYKDVSERVVKNMLFENPVGSTYPEKLNLWEFTLWMERVPYMDMLTDYGLEARARGIIDYLGHDFMCFIDRDKDTGKLMKITQRQNEVGEWIEEKQFVD